MTGVSSEIVSGSGRSKSSKSASPNASLPVSESNGTGSSEMPKVFSASVSFEPIATNETALFVEPPLSLS